MIPSTEQILQAHLIYLAAGGWETNTIDDAEWLLRKAHAMLPAGLLQAYPDELAAWLANPAWSAQTKSTYRAHLRRFYRWATREDDPWLTWDPSAVLHRPRIPRRLPRPASDEQVRAAITRVPWPWRLHCRLAAYLGLRCIEIARLRRQDVTESSTRVHGKGGRYRDVPTHPLVWETVREMPDGPVTSKLDGRRADADWVSHGTREQLHKAGIAISPHQLRHWYATTIQRYYRDQRVTQELLGHVSPASTAVYTLVADASMRAAIETLPDLTAPPGAA